MHQNRDIAALVDRHLPGHAVRSLTRLGGGTGSTAYELNGELVVRIRHDDAGAVDREAALLDVIAEQLPLPVPKVVFADPDAGALALTKLPGVPLLDRRVVDAERLAHELGGFVSTVHRVPAQQVAGLVDHDTGPLAEWLDAAAGDFRDIAAHLRASERAAVEMFLARPLPAEPPSTAFCHNDLGAEHVLVDPSTGHVTGVIDWSDAAFADPVRDLARLYRDLGPDMYERLVAHYDGVLDTGADVRAAFYARCALVEDIAYGLRTGERRYAEVARANLARTFG